MTSGSLRERLRLGWFCARSTLRRSWGATLTVALILGMLWGLVLGTAIGARRNATAYRRMLSSTDAFDVFVNPQLGSASGLRADEVARLPGVIDWDVLDGHIAVADSDDPEKQDMLTWSPRLGRVPDRFERFVMLAGRHPRATALDEALVNPEFLRAHRIALGDRFTLSVFSLPTMHITHQRVRIVGVGRSSEEAVKEGAEQIPRVLLSKAFNARYASSRIFFAVVVRLADGTDVHAFERAVNALVPGETVVFETRVGVQRNLDRSNRPQTLALLAFSVVVGVAVFIAALQLALQHADRETKRQGNVLAALGLTRRDATRIHRLSVAPGLGAAAAVGAVVALLLSPRFPIGVARRVEVRRGAEVHVAGLAIGLLAPAFLVLAAIRWGARTRRPRSPRVAGGQLRGPWPIALALRAVRATPRLLGATTLACALAVGALVLAANDEAFVTTPAREGWRWDALAGFASNSAESADSADEAALTRLGTAPDVAAVSLIRSGQIAIGRTGSVTSIIGFGVLRGDAIPAVLRGRMPIAGGEIAVGESLLRAERVHIGSSLRVGDGASARALRIVGTVVVPGLGFYPGADAPTLGGSAVVTLDEFRVLVPRGADPYAAIRFARPVAPEKQAGVVAAAVGRKPGEIALFGLRHNVDTTSLAAVRRTPVLLAAALAVLTTATMTQALFAATRRRRPTLEVLAALGADRRSIHWFVVGHAVMVVAAAMVTGTAVGVLLGRRAWGTVARSTGVAAGHVVPVRQLLAAAAVAVVIGVAASWLPARQAIHPELGTAPRAE